MCPESTSMICRFCEEPWEGATGFWRIKPRPDDHRPGEYAYRTNCCHAVTPNSEYAMVPGGEARWVHRLLEGADHA